MSRAGRKPALTRAALGAFDPTLPMRESTFTDALWAAAHRAGLLPLIASAYSQRFAGLPDHVRGELVLNSIRNVRTLAELAAIGDLFDRAGVRWLVFKGPVLSQYVYRVPGVRVYADLDVLVHPEDLEQAMHLLVEAGATLLDRNWSHIRKTEQSEISLELPRGTMLDLHWHPISNPVIRAAISLDVRLLFERLRRVDFGGISVPTLDPVDTICYTSLHAALSGAHQLRWLVDVRECLIAADAPPHALRQRARQLGCSLVVEVMVGRINTNLDVQARRFLAGGHRSIWSRLVQVMDRYAPLDPGPDQYSGRAIFGSTRATTTSSLGASMQAVRRARRAGLERRTVTTSVEILRRDAGTAADRHAWLDLARQHANVRLVGTARDGASLGGQHEHFFSGGAGPFGVERER